MPTTRLRPTFDIPLPVAAPEAIRRLRARVEAAGLGSHTISAGQCAEFFVPEPERRVWSPYLSVQIRAATRGSTLSGRFSPRPDLWTFYMFLYFLVSFAMVFGASLGYVQWVLGETAWGLWFIPGGMAAIALLYGWSFLGRHLGAHQMAYLRDNLDRVLADEFGSGLDLVQRAE